MVTHSWKFVGSTPYAKIYIDTRHKLTKIEAFKYLYYHNGLYPYHNPDYSRKIKRFTK